MSDASQQFNYPLSPDFIPEKKPSLFKRWLAALPPRKKTFVFAGVVLVVVGLAAGVYFLLAAKEISFNITPDHGDWDTSQEYVVNFEIEAGAKTHRTGFEATISYQGDIFNDPATDMTASYDNVALKVLHDSVKKEFNVTTNKGGGFMISHDGSEGPKVVNFLKLTVRPQKKGTFILKIKDVNITNAIEDDNADFNVLDLKNSNIIYISSQNGRELQENVSQILELRVHTVQDIVAFAAQLEYDPAKLKVETVSKTGAFTFSSPDEKNDVAAGTYSVVRGTYGDGQASNGNAAPAINNPVGFQGDAVVGLIKVTPLEQIDKTTLEVSTPKFVWDDGAGTLADVTGYILELSIVPEVPISEQLELTILESDYQCTKTGDKYNLTVSWRTNKKASGQLLAGGKTADDGQFSVAHTLSIDLGSAPDAQIGKYIISGKTETGELVESEGQDYNCEATVSPLKIRDLLVKPGSNSAAVTFLTVGGANEGTAVGELIKLEKADKTAADLSCIDKCKDATAVNAHKFSLDELDSNTKYILTVAANDGNNPKASTTASFTTKQKTVEKNTNVVLKVERDRACDSWLYCRSSAQIQNSKDKKENLCFDVGLCNELDDSGACVSPVDLGALGVSGANQTFPAPKKDGAAAEDNFKNLSGFSKVGMDWGVNSATGKSEAIEGLEHYAAMTTLGRNVNLPNSDFGSGDPWPWQGNDLGELNVVQDIFNFGNSQVVNNVLQISVNQDKYDERIAADVDGAVYAGAKVPLGNITAGDNYILSFNARAKDEQGKDILLQVKNGNVFSNFLGDSVKRLPVDGSPKQFVIKAGRKLTGGYTELIFNQINSDSYSKDDFVKEFYIDSVSLQPVLQVQNKTTANTADNFIARTCRLYPTASALGCEAVGSGGKLYRGWKGFCVEKDPSNPNLCLNWWPVDIIPGETDIFAADAQVGYKDRKPLYYCVESAGNYPYVRKSGNFDPGYLNGDSSKMMISLLGMPPIGWSRASGVYIFKSTGNFAESDIEQIVLFPQCEEGETNCFSKRDKTAPLILNRKNNWANYLLTSGELSKTINNWNDIVGYLSESSCENKDVPDDFFGANAIFEKGKFKSLQAGLCNRGASSTLAGGYTRYQAVIYLREKCNALVQVVDPFGKNYAWASRVLANSWNTGNDLGYKYNQDYAPYGAVVPPAENTNYPDLWKNPLYVMPPDETFGQAPYQVRAGSPYAIKTSSKQCTNAGKLGESCSVSADCNFLSGLAGQVEKGICEAKVNGGTMCIMGTDETIGKGCSTNYDCGYGMSGQSGLCMGINLTDNQVGKIGGGYGGGADRLSQLFVKSLAAWVWAPELNRYLQVCAINNDVPCVDNDTTCNLLKKLCWDNRTVLGQAPQVKKITVNKQESGAQTFFGFAGVTLRFNSSVSLDQLPLTAYRVDWGDGEVTEMTNLAIAPKTDPNNPHVLMHTYTCAGAAACVFVPKIQIQDNWEWCSGGDSTDPCPPDNNAWAAFNGTIVVKSQ